MAAAPCRSAEFPPWAYPPDLPDAPVTSSEVKTAPGSALRLTQSQINDPFFVPDWYPDTHSPMPAIVAQGDQPTIHACGLCHMANGEGHPTSGGLSSESVTYIENQLADFKAGLRKSPITDDMVAYAKALTDDQIHAAAQYFASLKRQQWTQVIEADTIPQTVLGAHGQTFVANGAMVPRPAPIVVVPRDPDLFALRASRRGFIAYVPVGSLAKGEALVTSGGDGKTLPCGLCHGADLKGNGDIPPIAGRSPLTLFRALNDIKVGARGGDNAAAMQGVVPNLSEDDMVALAAYVGSRAP